MAGRRKPQLDTDFLTSARLILADYQAFLANGPHAPEDGATKAFAARHAAARGALAHLEQLLKLAGEDQQPKLIAESLTEWRALMPPQAQEDTEADDDGAGG
jgi:hypothetical protein